MGSIKGSDLEGKGAGAELRGGEGGEIVIRIF